MDNKDLNSNDVDKGVLLLKGITGAIPFIGPMIAEIVGEIIPGQRIDRMSELLHILNEKLSKLEISQEELSHKMKEEPYVNLLEEGMWQAARSTSQERKEYIASILANGISNENLHEVEENILLSILSQLNDNEIIILYSYTMRVRRNPEFQKQHENILMKPLVHIGSNQEELDKATIYDTYRGKLVSLNLLRRDFKKPKRGELPEFDEKTGMVKASGYSLTPLGRLFLKYIDMPDEF
jgi:hypothetical protein